MQNIQNCRVSDRTIHEILVDRYVGVNLFVPWHLPCLIRVHNEFYLCHFKNEEKSANLCNHQIKTRNVGHLKSRIALSQSGLSFQQSHMFTLQHLIIPRIFHILGMTNRPVTDRVIADRVVATTGTVTSDTIVVNTRVHARVTATITVVLMKEQLGRMFVLIAAVGSIRGIRGI